MDGENLKAATSALHTGTGEAPEHLHQGGNCRRVNEADLWDGPAGEWPTVPEYAFGMAPSQPHPCFQ